MTIPAYTLAALLVSSLATGLRMIETRHKTVERQCYKTTRGLMGIFPGAPFYVYIADLTANLVYLRKFIIVACAFNAPACITHVRNDEQ